MRIMDENKIRVFLAEPRPSRVLIEEDIDALKTLSKLLTSYAKTQTGDPVRFDDTTRATFLSIAQTINNRVDEQTVNYSGDKYIIMAKGRRKLTLGFKREKDLYLGSEYGVNFLNACQNYFDLRPEKYYYNRSRNTFHGRMLYPMPVKESKSYDIGLSETASGGYSSWFIIGNFIFRLGEVKTRGEALIGCKMLHKAFQDMLTRARCRQ